MLRDRAKRDDASVMSGMSCSNLSVSAVEINAYAPDGHYMSQYEQVPEVGASSTHIQMPRSSSHQVRKGMQNKEEVVIPSA